MMKAAQLRQAILQAAVQGKLVPQSPNDEPASVLLEHICAEKARLIKEGKLRREKSLSPITEDEIHYDLPDGWEWYRLGELGDWGAGATPLRTDSRYYTNGTISWLKTGELNDGVIYESQEKISELALKECSLRLNKVGDVLVAMYGATIGKLAIVGAEMTTNQACCACTPFTGVYNWYLFFLLKAFKTVLVEQGEGGAQPNISRIKIRNQIVPLPPFEEQQRIVVKVEELMVLCNELEAAEKELDALDEYFIEYLPKSILQAAVQGKLVPQNIHDEPASELLERIRAEKTKLVKEGKLKKEKPLPLITEDDIPFDIPENWVWCRLGEISNYGRNDINEPDNIPSHAWLLELEDIEKETGRILKKNLKKDRPTKSTKYAFSKGQVLFGKLRPYLNKVVIASENGFCSSEILPLSFGEIKPEYSAIFLRSPFFVDYANSKSYGVKMPRLGTNDGIMALFPLPPLAEQERIVAKIEELLSLCGGLKKVEESASIIPEPTKIIKLSSKRVDEPLQMAARGSANQKSEKHQKAIDDMFSDD